MATTRRDFVRGSLAAGAAIAVVSKLRAQDKPEGAIPVPEPRIARFERYAFGLFIHWGLYSQLGRGEWVWNIEKLPREQYLKLKDTFTAADFDGRAIAKIAKQAGMKYITLTSRHHEGFSLYDTRGLSDWDAMHSPAKRDLIKEFVEGCRAEGIAPHLYHTTLDWHNEHYKNDFDKYLDYLHKSVEILCTQYGPIGGLWFDGNWDKAKADWKEDRLYSIIRKHQPECMIINNTGVHQLGKAGHPEIDSVTFEQGRPTPMDRRGMKKYLAAEMCQTMNRHWGIGANDFNYMSPKEIIDHLCACRKVGANYLLNVGPTATGKIPDYEAAALGRVGDYVRLHAKPLYDGKPSTVQCPGSDFALEADGTTYFFIHKLRDKANPAQGSGAGKRTFKGVARAVKTAKWMDSNQALKFSQENDVLSVECTGFPYGTDTVVRVMEVS